jgi:hypothetical protein
MSAAQAVEAAKHMLYPFMRIDETHTGELAGIAVRVTRYKRYHDQPAELDVYRLLCAGVPARTITKEDYDSVVAVFGTK